MFFGVDLAEQTQGALVLTGGKALCLVPPVCPSGRGLDGIVR